MITFRMDVHRKSGEVMLWMKSPCGFKPIMGWVDVEGVKEFAEILLGFCEDRKRERDRTKEVSDAYSGRPWVMRNTLERNFLRCNCN